MTPKISPHFPIAAAAVLVLFGVAACKESRVTHLENPILDAPIEGVVEDDPFLDPEKPLQPVIPTCVALNERCEVSGGGCCADSFCEFSFYTPDRGRCVSLRVDGEYCEGPGECASGVCTEYQCGIGRCFAENEECYGQEQPCCGTLFCDADPSRYGAGYCIQPRAEGEFCERPQHCTSGRCTDGLCAPRGPAGPVSFQRVYEDVLTAYGCTNGYCHGGGAGGLTMRDEASAYESLVGVAPEGAMCDAAARVTPGYVEESLIWKKVAPDVAVCGSKMPPSIGSLPPDAVELLRGWIEAGAPRE